MQCKEFCEAFNFALSIKFLVNKLKVKNYLLQLSKKMATIPHHAFPINDMIFPLGTLSQKTLNFGGSRCIPVIELSITDCSTDELKYLIAEAERRRRFGSMYVWIQLKN